MKIGDLVQPKPSAVLGSPEDWGLSDRDATIAKIRAFHGVGIVVGDAHADSALWAEPVVEILWSALGATQKQPVNSVEVIDESR